MEKFILRRAFRAALFSLSAIALFGSTVIAQSAPSTPRPVLPVYDAVSIHPHSAFDEHAGFSDSPDGLIGANITLKELVAYAYQVREDLISGLPAWVDSTRFDITVKVSDPDRSVMAKLTREETRAMLRPVLTDRFQLKVHNQINTLPIYDLVLAKGGPKFHQSPPPPDNPDRPASKGQHGKTSWQINDGSLTATALPLSTLINALAGVLDRTVIDKTGLPDFYDLNLKWTPREDANSTTDNGSTDHPPDLFTALQEQLGLKLVASKGPVTTLVVDHAEKPSPN
jgi:uncharacterized protein (TIGR03435 family)